MSKILIVYFDGRELLVESVGTQAAINEILSSRGESMADVNHWREITALVYAEMGRPEISNYQQPVQKKDVPA
jgi:hypothetical protein